MKTYPLDTERLYTADDSGDCWGYLSKGHHEPGLFIAALEEERDYTCTPAQVHQAHFRYVPEAAGPGRYIHAKPGKGVFPVTFVHYGDVRFVTDECGICEKCHSGTIPCVEQSGGDQLT